MELADDHERKSSIFDTAHNLAVQKFQEAKRKVSLKRVLAIDDDSQDPADGDIDVDDLLEDVEKDEGGEGKGHSDAEESPADEAQRKREAAEAEDNATTEKGTADWIASEPKPVNAAHT